MRTIHKILVPVDFSKHSAHALATAADLSARYQAPISIVHVYQPLDFGMPDGFMSYLPVQMSELLSVLQKQLQQSKQEAEQAGAFAVDTQLLQGSVASEIVGYAKENGYDLIVIGTHGHTGLKHVLLGSVAERVVRLAPCPVLSLHADAA